MFVRSELKNPSVTIGEIRLYETSFFQKNVQTVIRTSAAEFESESEFSNETLKFIEDSCRAPFSSPLGFNRTLFDLVDRNPLKIYEIRLDLVDNKDVTYLLDNGMAPLKSFWNGWGCPVKVGLKLEPQTVPINVRLAFSNRSNGTEEIRDDCVSI